MPSRDAFAAQREQLEAQSERWLESLRGFGAISNSSSAPTRFPNPAATNRAPAALATQFARAVHPARTGTNGSQLSSLRKTSDDIAADFLALHGTAVLCAEPRIRRLYLLAERLAAELQTSTFGNNGPSYHALISQSDRFGGSADAIHIGFVDLSLWALPRVAHEFGHAWLSTLNERVAATLLDSLPKPTWSETHGQEFLADMFAAYTLGPAYASSVLTLDFNPAERAAERSLTHPTGRERAFCVLRIIQSLAKDLEGTEREQAGFWANQLQSIWETSCSTTGITIEIPQQTDLTVMTISVYEAFKAKIPDARYTRIPEAQRARQALAKKEHAKPADLSWLDVLNGAWLLRWFSTVIPSEIEKTVLEWVS